MDGFEVRVGMCQCDSNLSLWCCVCCAKNTDEDHLFCMLLVLCSFVGETHRDSDGDVGGDGDGDGDSEGNGDSGGDSSGESDGKNDGVNGDDCDGDGDGDGDCK